MYLPGLAFFAARILISILVFALRLMSALSSLAVRFPAMTVTAVTWSRPFPSRRSVSSLPGVISRRRLEARRRLIVRVGFLSPLLLPCPGLKVRGPMATLPGAKVLFLLPPLTSRRTRLSGTGRVLLPAWTTRPYCPGRAPAAAVICISSLVLVFFRMSARTWLLTFLPETMSMAVIRSRFLPSRSNLVSAPAATLTWRLDALSRVRAPSLLPSPENPVLPLRFRP